MLRRRGELASFGRELLAHRQVGAVLNRKASRKRSNPVRTRPRGRRGPRENLRGAATTVEGGDEAVAIDAPVSAPAADIGAAVEPRLSAAYTSPAGAAPKSQTAPTAANRVVGDLAAARQGRPGKYLEWRGGDAERAVACARSLA